jgi:hypothetical protein
MPLDGKERQILIDRYAHGPARLREALAHLPLDALQWRPAPGEWSAHEVICHCADSETNSYARIRLLVAEPRPVIQGYDQDRWATLFDYHALPMHTALDVVEAVRAHTTALLRRLPDAAWQREGTHTESGRYSAEEWLRIYSWHLEGHAQQIEGNAAKWKERATR